MDTQQSSTPKISDNYIPLRLPLDSDLLASDFTRFCVNHFTNVINATTAGYPVLPINPPLLGVKFSAMLRQEIQRNPRFIADITAQAAQNNVNHSFAPGIGEYVKQCATVNSPAFMDMNTSAAATVNSAIFNSVPYRPEFKPAADKISAILQKKNIPTLEAAASVSAQAVARKDIKTFGAFIGEHLRQMYETGRKFKEEHPKLFNFCTNVAMGATIGLALYAGSSPALQNTVHNFAGNPSLHINAIRDSVRSAFDSLTPHAKIAVKVIPLASFAFGAAAATLQDAFSRKIYPHIVNAAARITGNIDGLPPAPLSYSTMEKRARENNEAFASVVTNVKSAGIDPAPPILAPYIIQGMKKTGASSLTEFSNIAKDAVFIQSVWKDAQNAPPAHKITAEQTAKRNSR